MATTKISTLTVTPIVPGPRVYPHVDQIGDPPTQMTIRQLWDRVHSLTDQLTAATDTITKAVSTVNATSAAVTTAQQGANQALALAQKVNSNPAGATGAGGSTGGSGSTGSDPGSGSGSGGTAPTSGSPAPSTPVTIDGISVIINGGSPDVSGWAKTTHLDSIDIGTVTPVFGKQTDPGSWPDVVPPGFSGPLQYTLWIFEQHNGQWYASGIVQFWRGRTVGGANMSCNNEVAKNWCYDSRWGPMGEYQPQPGETIGFMVTAGNQRGTDNHIVAERSNIVFIAFPTCGGPTAFPPYVSQT